MKFVNYYNFITYIVTSLCLFSCSSSPVMDRPIEVKVPLAISCISEEIPEPSWNMEHLQSDAVVTEKLKAIMADLELSKGYVAQLKAELMACS